MMGENRQDYYFCFSIYGEYEVVYYFVLSVLSLSLYQKQCEVFIEMQIFGFFRYIELVGCKRSIGIRVLRRFIGDFEVKKLVDYIL